MRNRLRAACLGLIVLLGACTAPPYGTPTGDAVIYVVERGWHTDIGLPIEAIDPPLASLAAGFPGVRFLTFGFGERAFVVDRKQDVGSMLTALLPSRSALLMTALKTSPQAAFGTDNVVALRVSRDGLARIEASIWRELDRTAAGQPDLLAEGPYPGSVFYAARDTYWGLFTCNTWTAATLRAGDLPMPESGVLFSGQVMGQARAIAARQP